MDSHTDSPVESPKLYRNRNRYAYDKNKPNKEDADMFKKFIQRIIEAENREDTMQNDFQG